VTAGGTQRFGPEHRIRHRPEFLEIYDRGRKLHGRLVVLFARWRPVPLPNSSHGAQPILNQHHAPSESESDPAGGASLPAAAEGPWRLGLAATRKLGKATVRNLLRRRAREIFRRHGALPPGWDFVVNFKPAAIAAPYAELAAELTRLIEKALQDAARRPRPVETGPAPGAPPDPAAR
jgi:ribonuclease P protein component